jgi:hypothetical protein
MLEQFLKADFEVLNTQVPGGHDIRLHPHLRHAGVGYVHKSAIWRNRTDCLPRKQQHGSEHHVDSAIDSKGDGATGTVITESAATTADSLDPNPANNTATASIKV